MEQQWRNGLGRPDRLCGRRFDPERTFFTNQDFFSPIRSRPIPLVIVVGLDPLPVSLDGQDTRFSPWRPGFDSRTGNALPFGLGQTRALPI